MSVGPLLARGASDLWQTPASFLSVVRRFAPIALDPCAPPENNTAAAVFWTAEHDGLTRDWRDGGGLVFVNFPYSQAARWAAKIDVEAARGVEIISLPAARTDTRWWRTLTSRASALCLHEGRIRFVPPPERAQNRLSGPAFPSAVVYHGPRPGWFQFVFQHLGRVYF